ncbi:hypothetical protein F2Q69_00026405 [Brassica cretica]|uniref:Uncharacterized protein n=1 Tax=Brassica cretica TaxID=69181 RepID=A0A8S9S9V7_BRACR|nr:hypothetical protein F2Q69_00026405 [Brassica cretica]
MCQTVEIQRFGGKPFRGIGVTGGCAAYDAATDGTAAVRVGSTSKGKEKVTYPNNDGSQLLNLQIGSASGDAAYGRADIEPND